jgi:hypothetical protein
VIIVCHVGEELWLATAKLEFIFREKTKEKDEKSVLMRGISSWS